MLVVVVLEVVRLALIVGERVESRSVGQAVVANRVLETIGETMPEILRRIDAKETSSGRLEATP